MEKATSCGEQSSARNNYLRGLLSARICSDCRLLFPIVCPLHARAILQQPQKPRSKSKLSAEKETSGTKSTDPCLFRARQNCTEKLTEIKCALVRSACLRLEQWHLYIEAMVRCTSGPCGVRQTTIQPDNYTTTQRWKHARQDQNICNWAVAL